MPIHDWTRVGAGIFHHFHHSWVDEMAGALNRGLLPPDHYALAEQFAGGLGPDVLTLQAPAAETPSTQEPCGGVALASAPPKVQFRLRAEPDRYAAKAKSVVIRHASGHRVVAVVEVVSPGNKSNRHGLRAFVGKAVELLKGGIHLLVIDLLPPGPRDPQGIHKAIWDEFVEDEFSLPADKPLTLVSYIAGLWPEAFVQPTAVGAPLPEMPVFLTPDVYVPLPLEASYQTAWDKVPAFWKNVLQAAK